MKKLVSILCASLLCVSGSSIYASAEGNETPPDDPIVSEYLYTNSISSTLSINTSGSATGTSSVFGSSSLVTQIVVHQYLQKKNGSDWDTIDSWSSTRYTWYNECSFPYTITSSGEYRIRTVADVYSGNDYETVSSNSKTSIY